MQLEIDYSQLLNFTLKFTYTPWDEGILKPVCPSQRKCEILLSVCVVPAFITCWEKTIEFTMEFAARF